MREYVDGKLAIIGNNNNRLKYKVVDKPVEQKPKERFTPGCVSKRYRVKWLVGNWVSYKRTGRMAANLT